MCVCVCLHTGDNISFWHEVNGRLNYYNGWQYNNNARAEEWWKISIFRFIWPLIDTNTVTHSHTISIYLDNCNLRLNFEFTVICRDRDFTTAYFCVWLDDVHRHLIHSQFVLSIFKWARESDDDLIFNARTIILFSRWISNFNADTYHNFYDILSTLPHPPTPPSIRRQC